MEQTPFDPFSKQSENAPLPSEPSAPYAPPASYAPPPPAPTMPIGAELPPSRVPRKKTNPALWLVPLALLLVVAGGFGFATWQKKQEERAREEKLASLRADIKKLALQDNALVMELLDDDATEGITYAEFFKRAEKNKEERDELIRRLRATETGPYGEAVGHYVELLETENEWVRAEEAVTRAGLEASSKWDAYSRASSESSQASGRVESSFQAYLAAPYGLDYGEKMSHDLAKSRLASATEAASDSFDGWKTAQNGLRDKKRAALVVINDWLRNEPRFYLNFAPKRDATRLLIKRKAAYANAGQGASTSASASIEPSDQNSASSENSEAATAPRATPAPKFPTRVRALKPLDGERFPATRMNDLSPDDARNMSDEDLRLAINEMYARYGMTFKDKTLQSEFEETTWYEPNSRWTMPQIKRAFGARERANLDVLVSERSDRQNIQSDGGEETGERMVEVE